MQDIMSNLVVNNVVRFKDMLIVENFALNIVYDVNCLYECPDFGVLCYYVLSWIMKIVNNFVCDSCINKLLQ